MTEPQFWKLLDLLDWKKPGNDGAVVRPLVKALAHLPEKLTGKDNPHVPTTSDEPSATRTAGGGHAGSDETP